MLQTAASVANVAVTTYEAVVGLPSMADIPALAKTFLTKTRDQHGEHSRAFNGAATRLGGVPQNAANRELKKLVDAKLPTLRSPADTLDLLTMIERAAAETYV